MQDPSTPAVVCRLEDLPLTDDATAALADAVLYRQADRATAAAEQDPVLAARILAWVGGQRLAPRPRGLRRLLARFKTEGLLAFVETTLSAASSAARATSLDTEGPAAFAQLRATLRRYACRVALQAREHVVDLGGIDPDATYLAALLESLGMFALACRFPLAYRELLAGSDSRSELRRQERGRFGTSSSALRRRLARLWGFPDWMLVPVKLLPGGGAIMRASAECWPILDNNDPPLPTSAETDPSRLSADCRLAPDTLGELVRLVRDHEQLRAEREERLEQEKLASLAEFAAGAGHEINNPLAVIYGRAQLLLAKESDPERRRALLTMGTQAMRIHEMIADLMLFARPPEPNRETLDLAPLVRETFATLASRAADQGIALRFQPPSTPVRAWADPVQTRVLVINLLTNCLETLTPGGTIEVTVTRRTRSRGAARVPAKSNGRNGSAPSQAVGDFQGEFAMLRIRDDGPGMTGEVRRHLFDPFYSGRPAGRGLGLGLAKCWRIANAHGGAIHVKSRIGRGTTFTVLLPQNEPASPRRGNNEPWER